MKLSCLCSAFYFLINFTSLWANQPPITLQSNVDKNKITIGDQVVYRVELKYDSCLKVELPNIAAQLSSFEIKDYKIEGPKKHWGKTILRHRYVISTFTTGEYAIPPLLIAYWDEKGEKKQISANKMTIFVESVKPKPTDKDDIREIKPPVFWKHSFWFWFILILIPVMAAAGIWGYKFYQQRKLLDILADSGSFRPPEEIARERLAKLKETDLLAQEKIKEYYIILAEIVRKYLEARYRIPVIDRTTSELYWEMREAKVDKKHSQLVKGFLEECDLVKFAKYIPESEIVGEDFSTAEKIVELTTPVPVEVN
ncbi:MAG: hypothetical protein ABII74_06400 [Elusimicrobiota bacterium]